MTTPENPVNPDGSDVADPESAVFSEVPGAEAGLATGSVEDAAQNAAPSAPGEGDVDPAAAKEAELTADLQRVSAEFANYRKRTAREVIDARAAGKAAVVGELLVVVDDLARARSHGDLESGPLKAVSDKFDAVLGKLGLTAFGAEGDPFDPAIHEAVQHEGDGSDPILGAVLRQGYQIDGKVIRTAMVAVTDRPDTAPAGAESGADSVDSENRA